MWENFATRSTEKSETTNENINAENEIIVQEKPKIEMIGMNIGFLFILKNGNANWHKDNVKEAIKKIWPNSTIKLLIILFPSPNPSWL